MIGRITTITAIAVLATGPALAASNESHDHGQRGMGVGVAAAGVFGALVGGPAGAIAGMALVGITMDREFVARRAGDLEQRTTTLEAERLSLLSERMSLRSRLEELGRLELEWKRVADAAVLADGLEFSLGFRTNSAMPPAESTAGLEALALLVGAVPTLEVHLDGYADPRGSESLNHRLSQARAEAVRDRLVEAGVESERIHVKAHGAIDSDTAARAGDPDGWALQRRVSIRLESREGRLASNQ
jgi:outer membrane protein OmpA-like peptidoglycan-associated protein